VALQFGMIQGGTANIQSAFALSKYSLHPLFQPVSHRDTAYCPIVVGCACPALK